MHVDGVCLQADRFFGLHTIRSKGQAAIDQTVLLLNKSAFHPLIFGFSFINFHLPGAKTPNKQKNSVVMIFWPDFLRSHKILLEKKFAKLPT